MPVRYYLAPIVGTGVYPNGYRPNLTGITGALRGGWSVPTGTNGQPVTGWTLLTIDAAAGVHTALTQHAALAALPDLLRSATPTNAQRTQIKNGLTKVAPGVGTGFVDRATTFGAILDGIAALYGGRVAGGGG